MMELENIYKFFSKIFSGQKFRGPSKFRRKTHKCKFSKWPKITTWHQKIRFFGRITIHTPNILEKWLNTLKIPSLIYRLWKSAESADLSKIKNFHIGESVFGSWNILDKAAAQSLIIGYMRLYLPSYCWYSWLPWLLLLWTAFQVIKLVSCSVFPVLARRRQPFSFFPFSCWRNDLYATTSFKWSKAPGFVNKPTLFHMT